MTTERKQMFEQVFLEAINLLREEAPKDTGNLAYNAIKYKWENENEFVIYVDVGKIPIREYKKEIKGIAPYMPYTNEPWISPRWNGNKNPNEGWWNDAIEFIIQYMAKRLGGELQ